MVLEMRTHYAYCANSIPINPLTSLDSSSSKYKRTIVMALCNYISHQPKAPPRDLNTLLSAAEYLETAAGGGGEGGGVNERRESGASGTTLGEGRGGEAESILLQTSASNDVIGRGVCITNFSASEDDYGTQMSVSRAGSVHERADSATGLHLESHLERARHLERAGSRFSAHHPSHLMVLDSITDQPEGGTCSGPSSPFLKKTIPSELFPNHQHALTSSQSGNLGDLADLELNSFDNIIDDGER
jgi:hypothetical protein